MSQSKGYCLAYRQAWKHPAFNNLREAAIWNFLYQNAAYENCEVNFNNHTFKVKRGQYVTSISFLAKGFCMSDKGVRVVIQKLQKLGMLGVQGASKGTTITICNYDVYQLNLKTEGEQEGKQGANGGRAKGDNNNKGINKGSKKVNKEEVTLEELSLSHVQTWLDRKRKDGYYKNIDEVALLEYYKNWACGTKKKVNCHVSTFRNAFMWNDIEKKCPAKKNDGRITYEEYQKQLEESLCNM